MGWWNKTKSKNTVGQNRMLGLHGCKSVTLWDKEIAMDDGKVERMILEGRSG